MTDSEIEDLERRVARLEAAVRYLASRDNGDVMGIPGLANILSGRTAKQEVEAMLNPEKLAVKSGAADV